MKMVYGKSDWSEGGKDFLVTYVDHGESDQSAIARAKSYCYPWLGCYIVDDGNIEEDNDNA